MKNLLFVILLIPALAFSNPQPLLDGIAKAIKSGNANALGQYFDASVEISILDNEDIYDKGEAVQVVQQFFNKYKPSTYNQAHKGVSKSTDSQYSIGDLKAGGEQFRVYVYMKMDSANPLIQEIRIDKN